MDPTILKTIRKSLGLNQAEVASVLGIKVAAYSKLERGIIQLTVDRLTVLSRLFRLSPNEIIFYDAESKMVNNKQDRQNVNYIPIAAQAGLLNDFSQQDTIDAGVKFLLPMFYEDDLFSINLEGDSMYPTFCNGDYILVRQLKSDYHIKWGEPYFIVTYDGQVVKRVMKSNSINKLLLKSDNDLYEPYEIEESIIRSIWEVKGFISKNLAPRIFR